MSVRNISMAVVVAVLSFGAHNAAAQRIPGQYAVDELPVIAIDTLPTDKAGRKLVINSNGTWRYMYDDLDDLVSYAGFRDHWDTASVFAYRDFTYDTMPDVLELEIVDSLWRFSPPVVGKVFSPYGRRRRSNHNGVDLPKPVGTPIYATFDGRVRYARYNTGGYGYMVILRHTNELESWYGHMCRLAVSSGDYVRAGQIIGYVGNTGRSRGSHLHFELRYRDQTFDPEFLVDFENGKLRYKVFPLEKSYLDIHSHASEILQEFDDDWAIGSLLAEAGDSVAIRAAIAQQKAIDSNGQTVVKESSAVYHTVKSGDILGRIAIRYGTTVDRICKLNNISRNSILRLGQRLRVR